MKFFKPANLNELFKITDNFKGKIYFLAGGTDINVQIKNKLINDENIVFINHLRELKGIRKENDKIVFGALTTFKQIINSHLIKDNFPILSDSLQNFASPPIQTSATIGGNIANGSPTADIVPLLMILDADIIAIGKKGNRQININEFYQDYKQNSLKNDEIIKEIWINTDAQKDDSTFYQKVGARQILTIAKVSLAGLIKEKNGTIKRIKLAVGSLNEYARRLGKLEKFLLNKQRKNIDFAKVKKNLTEEITPITDLRSDKDYRFAVCYNLIVSFLKS